MNRRAIPAFAMSEIGQESLRREGIVVTSIAESVHHDPQRLRPHYHDFFQMMLLHGNGAVMHDFRDYEVRGAALLFLSPGQVHMIRPRRGYGGIIVSFTQSFFDHTASPPSLLFDLPFFFAVDASPLLPIPRGDRFRVGEAFAEMQQEFDRADAGAADVLRAWLHIAFARVSRLFAQRPAEESAARQPRIVREFHLAVERGFREEQALSTYARELGVTANHLNDVIRAATGQSAGAIVRGRRLLDAKRLLSHSDLGVAEIGYQLGFADPSYFGRFFRRETGRTPAEFRSEIREKYQTKAR